MPNLNALLGDIPYVVVGGVAASRYMPARYTEDVDILVRTDDAPRVEAALRQAGARFVGALNIGGTSWELPDGTTLDVLTSEAPWVREALARPNRDPSGLPIIALPYLVLLKLLASRGVDIGDLSRMLGGADPATLAEVRAVVGKYLPDALEDVESLIRLGRLEFQTETSLVERTSSSDKPPAGEKGRSVSVREHLRRGRRVREHRRRRPGR